MKTKKLLVAVDPKNPEKRIREFLLPYCEDEKLRFLGLSSGRYYDYGMVVMVGSEVTENDLFAKLIELGKKIDDVNFTIEYIEDFMERIKSLKIGNIVKLNPLKTAESSYEFIKEKIKLTPRKSLP